MRIKIVNTILYDLFVFHISAPYRVRLCRVTTLWTMNRARRKRQFITSGVRIAGDTAVPWHVARVKES